MANAEIIPSLLVDSKEEFERRLRLIENDAAVVQVDVLDGSKHDATSWFDAEAVAAMNPKCKFELHLMIENPLPVIEAWSQHVPGTIRAIIHAELDRPIGTIIELIHQNHKLEAGLALNPETPIDEIIHLIPHLDEILIMGVHPGASGQDFGDTKHKISGEAILEKIERVHHRYPNLVIGIDGGVTLKRIPGMIERGALRLATASAIFASPEPVDALRKMQILAKK